MALRKHASGHPFCKSGGKLAVVSPELQEAWAKDKGLTKPDVLASLQPLQRSISLGSHALPIS